MKIFPYEHPRADDQDQTFLIDKITSSSQHSGQKWIIFALYVLPLQKNANIIFTGVHNCNEQVYIPQFCFFFLEFHPGRQG